MTSNNNEGTFSIVPDEDCKKAELKEFDTKNTDTREKVHYSYELRSKNINATSIKDENNFRFRLNMKQIKHDKKVSEINKMLSEE